MGEYIREIGTVVVIVLYQLKSEPKMVLAFKGGDKDCCDKASLDPEMAKKFKEAEQFRRLAFVGVAFSTISIIIAVVSVPMIYNYVQAVQSVLQNEVDFCKVSGHTPPSLGTKLTARLL